MELNDSEIIKLERVLQWAQSKQKTMTNIDQFVRDFEEQINRCGFTGTAKVYDTEQEGVYGFELELTGRIDSHFDPDRQVHEVTSNLLNLPGQDKGFIPSKEYLDRLAQREMRGNKNKGGHHH